MSPPGPPPSLCELVERIRVHRRAANSLLEQLLRQVQPRLNGLAEDATVNGADRDDVVLETQVRLGDDFDTITATTESQLVAWLRTTLRHVYLDMLRERAAGRRGGGQEIEGGSAVNGATSGILAPAASSPSSGLKDEENRSRTAEELRLMWSMFDRCLTLQQRVCLLLNKLRQEPDAFIATVVGTSEESVRQSRSAALQKLQEEAARNDDAR